MLAQLFLHLNLSLGSLNVLPEWVGYLLLFRAIAGLSGVLRDIGLLSPLCALLGGMSALQWLAVTFGFSALFSASGLVSGLASLLALLLQVVGIYFNFQLLTDLSALPALSGADSERYAALSLPPSSDRLRRDLLLRRNVLTVLGTLLALLTYVSAPEWSYLLLLGLSAAATLAVVLTLWDLYRLFREEPPAPAQMP
ncbi:MAG: hypothetical protein SOY13_03650 [Pseudoflavonifractor sp.]|nr:hypothetical protein [Pseudoflavonifractor sp.]